MFLDGFIFGEAAAAAAAEADAAQGSSLKAVKPCKLGFLLQPVGRDCRAPGQTSCRMYDIIHAIKIILGLIFHPSDVHIHQTKLTCGPSMFRLHT